MKDTKGLMYVRQERHLTMVLEVITGNCVKSLKGCNNSPSGSFALFSKAWVCGIFVKVHRNELQKKKSKNQKKINNMNKKLVLR